MKSPTIKNGEWKSPGIQFNSAVHTFAPWKKRLISKVLSNFRVIKNYLSEEREKRRRKH